MMQATSKARTDIFRLLRAAHERAKQLNGNAASARIDVTSDGSCFDSGLGGLTVLREIVGARPDAHYLYVADDAFFPYGHHREEEIIARVVPLIGELLSAHRPDLVVIACNTASTLVMSHLRERYDVPFVGTVPAIKPACAASENKTGVGARHQGHRQARIHPGR